MFREKLKNDLNGISPDEELLDKVTKMMQEEALKPRPKMHITAMKYVGMAAAVCLVAVGAITVLGVSGGFNVANETAAADIGYTEAKNASDFYSDGAAAGDTYAYDGEAYSEEEAFEDGDYIADTAGDYVQAAEENYAEDTAESMTDGAASEGTAVEEETSETIAALALPEYENKGIYKTAALNPSVHGTAASYEEIANGRTEEIDSFYRIRITGVLDKEAAQQLKGFDPHIDGDVTFYNAEIEYDYLNRKDLSESIILRIPGDNEYGTVYGCPVYSEGDVIATVLQKNTENADFMRRFSYAFHYDIYEIEGVSYAAVRSQSVPEVQEGLTDYFGGETVEHETTTLGNPAIYYGLYEIEGIAANLRELWGY